MQPWNLFSGLFYTFVTDFLICANISSSIVSKSGNATPADAAAAEVSRLSADFLSFPISFALTLGLRAAYYKVPIIFLLY